MLEFSGILLSLVIGLIIGFVLGRKYPQNTDFYDFLRRMYTNLDNLVMAASVLVVVGSIYFLTIGKLEIFASVTINVFGSVIFSWILTKKSSKEEFRKEQEELALRSFRHINYIEAAANTAYKKLESYKKGDHLDENTKLILDNAMDQIKYIQGGINTCKLDWLDMISMEKRGELKNSSDFTDEQYGSVDMEVSEIECNQEQA